MDDYENEKSKEELFIYSLLLGFLTGISFAIIVAAVIYTMVTPKEYKGKHEAKIELHEENL